MTQDILALDIGSSGVKAVLYAADGTARAEAGAGYPTLGARPGWQEQDPAAWWDAVATAARGLPLGPGLQAVVLSGSMQNLILLDAAGMPVRPAMLYSDSRAGAEFAACRDRLAALGADRLCGNQPELLMPAFKALWVRAHEPAIWARTAGLLFGAKDFVAFRLCGARATDPATATTSGLMDFARLDWAPALLDLAGIGPGLLPAIRPATDRLGTVSAEASAATGIPAGTPVIQGCGDAGASTVGTGMARPGDAHVYLGTSGWVAALKPSAARDRLAAAYALAHPFDPAQFIAIAPILSAGDCVGWLRGMTGLDGAAFDRLVAAADAAPGQVLFLPYLKGERSPFADADVRGGFLGLDRGDGPGALAYAVLEGVAFALRHTAQSLGTGDGPVAVIGGGAESPVWPQIIADTLGRPVALPRDPRSVTAFGAWRIAAQALGLPPAAPGWASLVAPRPDRFARRDALYARFLDAAQFARGLAQRACPAGNPAK